MIPTSFYMTNIALKHSNISRRHRDDASIQQILDNFASASVVSPASVPVVAPIIKKPSGESEIIVMLNKDPNTDVNYVYDNEVVLLDIAIDVSSLKAFNMILDMPNISLETLLHSVNYLEQKILQLPKNKTRKIMKTILDNKLAELGINL
jgi:hypothetical protein